MEDKVVLSKCEYDDMLEYMQRLQETIEVMSNTDTMNKLHSALNRVESGEYLTKEDMMRNV